MEDCSENGIGGVDSWLVVVVNPGGDGGQGVSKVKLVGSGLVGWE